MPHAQLAIAHGSTDRKGKGLGLAGIIDRCDTVVPQSGFLHAGEWNTRPFPKLLKLLLS